MEGGLPFRIDDGKDDLLNLVVEIKGYRGEDAKAKSATMENYWVPGINNLKKFGRWAFVEFGDVWEMETDFGDKVEEAFARMITQTLSKLEQGEENNG